MKPRIKRGSIMHSTRSPFFVLLLSLTITSCSKKDLGHDVVVSVVPEKAYIVGTEVPSCVDLARVKAGEELTRSVSKNSISFSRFKFTWDSSDYLYVSSISITLSGEDSKGRGVSGTPISLSADEIEALLGVEGGILTKANNLDSRSPNRETTTAVYPPCSLSFGGISVDEDASAFTGEAVLEIFGMAENTTDNTFKPVYEKVNLQVEWPGVGSK